MHPAADLILASGSPRRSSILSSTGVRFAVEVPRIDDSSVSVAPGDPAATVQALAWFKAREVADRLPPWPGGPRLVLAADTMCFLDGRPIGKPADAADARRMLEAFAGRSHEVLTGLCLVDRCAGTREIRSDSASVSLGLLGAEEVDAYVASGEWEGKAGAYNYADRTRAGWPLRCDGDPETVMGLPSRIVLALLRGRGGAP